MPSKRIYFYKLTADDGGAPCIQEGLLSLAICKPMIRSTAESGDLIFGFAANSLHCDNRLIYIARITARVQNGEYYREERFARRDDRVYEWCGNQYGWRRGALHHGPGDLKHDLGEPPGYDRAHVLLSRDFRYLGIRGTDDYKSRFPAVEEAVEQLGRGHRVGHTPQLREQLLALQQEIWRDRASSVAGQPTSQPRPGVCHRGRSCGVLME